MPLHRSGLAILSSLAVLGAASTSSAFTFSRVGDGSSQLLSWHWEYQSSTYRSCQNDIAGCGNVFSSDGRIPLSEYNNGSAIKAGGMLDWTASSGSLKVVAMATGRAWPNFGWSMMDERASVNARDVPLQFLILPEAGDPTPFNLSLLIRPSLQCTWNAYTYPSTEVDLTVALDWTISVNGVVVARDTVNRDFVRSNGQISSETLGLPRPAGVVVPNVAGGSVVTISVWAYTLTHTTGSMPRLDMSSAYGQGPALEFDLRSAQAVGVEEWDASPARLALAARPNPTRGRTRVAYDLPRDAEVRLAVYDIAGHRVSVLHQGPATAGRHELEWNGAREDGRFAPSGVYVVELIAGAERRTQKVVRLGAN